MNPKDVAYAGSWLHRQPLNQKQGHGVLTSDTKTRDTITMFCYLKYKKSS